MNERPLITGIKTIDKKYDPIKVRIVNKETGVGQSQEIGAIINLSTNSWLDWTSIDVIQKMRENSIHSTF